MKKVCELCKSTARIYCDSDQASLCWDCDAVVHSENFLVARHCRSLLCHVCQSPTPWNASGDKLGRTISVCERCVDGYGSREESQGGNDDQIGTDDEFDDDDGDSSDELDEDGDNQVVPWSPGSPPPVATSSSSCNESSSRFCNRDRDGDISSKRFRENPLDLSKEDDPDCTTYRMTQLPSPAAGLAGSRKDALVDSLPSRPLKRRRSEANQSARVHNGPAAGSRTEAIVGSLERIKHQRSGDGICK